MQTETSSMVERKKKTIRKSLLTKRDALPQAIRAAKSSLINHTLSEKLTALTSDSSKKNEPQYIAVYQAMNSEVSVDVFIRNAYERGFKVCFPCMTKGSPSKMVFRALEKDSYLSKNNNELPSFLTNPLTYYSMEDPALRAHPVVDPNDLLMVVVPLVAFDNANSRLGYGGGNYDRLLASLDSRVTVVGVAFVEQFAEGIPTESHDIPLPEIVSA